MDLLLDTHIALWALNDDPKLPEKAFELINDLNNNIYFSAISVMEISIKHNKFPDIFEMSGEAFYSACLESGYYTLPLKPKHARLIDGLVLKEGYSHNDPFDRALLAQAKQEDFIFLTHDHMFEHYDERCILLV